MGVINKYKSRELAHGRLMVDDFSAKECHKFEAHVNRKKEIEILLSFLQSTVNLNKLRRFPFIGPDWKLVKSDVYSS